MDNTTAVAYLHNMGSTHFHKLLHLALEVWEWCEKRNIFLLPQHSTSKTNVKAEAESPVKRDLSDWRIHSKVLAPLIRHCTVAWTSLPLALRIN
jgi:hypothetical protein